MERMNKKSTAMLIALFAAVLAIALVLTSMLAPRGKKEVKTDAPDVRAVPVSLETVGDYTVIFNDILQRYGYTEKSLGALQQEYAEYAGDDPPGYRGWIEGGVQEIRGFNVRENAALYAGGEADTGMISGGESTSALAAQSDGAGISNDYDGEPIKFSDTNNQTIGVQEADVIKSDGRYIYALNSEKLNIIKANGADPKLVASLAHPSAPSEMYFEMMLTETRLVAIKERLVRDDKDFSHTVTGLDVFDITDPEHPQKLNSLTQSGSYNGARLIGDDLYLISDFFYTYDIMMNMKRDDPSTFAPLYSDAGKTSCAAPEDIVMSPERTDTQYMLISGIDISGDGAFVSKKSLFGTYGTLYASEKNIYIAQEMASTESEYLTETVFSRVSIKDGEVNFEASSRVPGRILNQFSMDEYDGVFRVVATSEVNELRESSFLNNIVPSRIISGRIDTVTTNAVYTMGADMNIIGSITGLAEEERVYSARFMGDYAYFVTFRQVDPLFSVDLRDPENPKIVGALKIPGFSEYLHPYDTGLLFGLGEEISEDGAVFKGIKLSMFTNADPNNVKEEAKLVLENYHSAPTGSDHKLILVDSAASLIAFPADASYVICSYGDGGFKREKEIEVTDDDLVSYDIWYGVRKVRGMFIGDYFYVISPRNVAVYDMRDDYRHVGSVAIGAQGTTPVERPANYQYTYGIEID
jgi:uncharacterized secreted protein with C-terminal beta-propeller domain